MNQIEMVTLDELSGTTYLYRRMKGLIDFDRVIRELELPEHVTGAIGYTKRLLLLSIQLAQLVAVRLLSHHSHLLLFVHSLIGA